MHDRHNVAAGIARLEGHLLAQAEISHARAEAEAFAHRMPWLTAAQHEEVVRLYAEERLALTRRTLETIVARTRELRAEYTARYQQLRRRLMGTTVAALLVAVALCSLTVLMGLAD